jgi:hypothetical protein
MNNPREREGSASLRWPNGLFVRKSLHAYQLIVERTFLGGRVRREGGENLRSIVRDEDQKTPRFSSGSTFAKRKQGLAD